MRRVVCLQRASNFRRWCLLRKLKIKNRITELHYYFPSSYASTSLEMQLRQLADVAFLLQSYDLAFQSYHQVKKDFQSSNAWLYYAAAVVSLNRGGKGEREGGRKRREGEGGWGSEGGREGEW